MAVRIGSEVAVLALVCILTIFFFPAMHGPYSVVHGPATALQAAHAAARLRIAIVRAALNNLGNWRIALVAPLPWTVLSLEELRSANLAECRTVLRC